MHLGQGLESIGKTRFGSIIWSAISLCQSLVAIQELVSNGSIMVKVRPEARQLVSTIYYLLRREITRIGITSI